MQGLRAVAWAWLIAAAVAKEVPGAFTAVSVSIKDRSVSVDQAAKKADQAAELATAEASEEEQEERAIEESVQDGSGLAEVGLSDPSVAPVVASSASLRGAAQEVSQPSPAAKVPLSQQEPKQSAQLPVVNAVDVDAQMSRLKKAMEEGLEKKNTEARQKKVAEAEAAAKRKTAALEKHRAAQARLRKMAEIKRLELERLEAAEAETKRKMAGLMKRKAEEEAHLRKLRKEDDKARSLKAKAEVRSNHEVDVDTFVHNAVMKKYGQRLKPEALKKAEARMRSLVEAKLKRMHPQTSKNTAVKKTSATRTRKFDLDAYVKKVVAAKIKSAGLHYSKSVLERLQRRMEAKLKLKVLDSHQKRMKAKGAPKRVAMVHKASQTKEEDEDQDEEEEDEAQSKEDNVQEDASASDEEKDAQDSSEDEGQSEDASEDREQSSDDADAEDSSESGAKEDEEKNEQDEEDGGGAEEEAEAFIQKAEKAKVMKQPVLFSTDDADLQPFLRPENKEAIPRPYSMCDELCKYDIGNGAHHELCVADCRSFVDAGGSTEALKLSVTEKTPTPPIAAPALDNEQAGQPMEDEDSSLGLKADSSALNDLDGDLDPVEVPL